MSDDIKEQSLAGVSVEEEFVPEDDAIIGKAFRWSLVALLVILVAIGAIVVFSSDKEVVEEVVKKDLGAILDLDAETSSLPALTFRNVTEESGITFIHENGATGEKLLPETMGGGAAFFDYDQDGDQDLLLVSGTSWPHDSKPKTARTMELYKNDGKGAFENVTKSAGLDVPMFGMGACVGDYDGDGDPDLFIACVGTNHLYRNDKGVFVDVTDQGQVEGDSTTWSSSAGFFDFDNDDDLDLFVCNYVRWSREIDSTLAFTLNGTDRAYGPPKNYMGEFSYLYRNDGQGVFTDVSEAAGIQVKNEATGVAVAKALALTFIDLDHDKFLDVIVANDTVQNFVFHNQGDGTFEEVGIMSGIAFGSEGNATGAMGIDAGYIRNDDSLAVGIGNFANEMSSLYVSHDQPLSFSDDAIGEGIGSPSRLCLSFGLFFFDADLDGRLDMLQANGHLEETINEIQESQHYRQAPQLFWNCGPEQRSCFVEMTGDLCGDLSEPIVGRGATYADIDGDGDLDVLLTQTGESCRLLRNDQALGNHWLRVRLEGAKGNREAIGATLELKTKSMLQQRHVMPTRSYLCQVEQVVTFGLGKETQVESLRVIWPDGTSQDVEVTGIDRTMTVKKSEG